MAFGVVAGGSVGHAHGRRDLARWSVGLAKAVVVVLAVSYTIFGVTWAIGGRDSIEDTWVGYLGGAALLGGMLVAFIAFVMAVVARVRHEVAALLWLPLFLFPALLAVVVVVETLWME